MNDNGTGGKTGRPAPMATGPSICPACGEAFPPLPFYRERSQLYLHLKTTHEWTAEQVDELRGKPKPKAPKTPRTTVKTPPGQPKGTTTAAPMSATDFARRAQRMGELAPRIATTGNQLLLQGLMMFGWFPPPLLVEFKSEPLTGVPLPQWDKPTEFGRAVMLDDKECLVYGAAWAFSEGTPVMAWLEDRIGTIAPVLAALACAVVTFKHLRTVRELAQAPAVLAFKDQFAAAVAEAQRQAQAQAQTPPTA